MKREVMSANDMTTEKNEETTATTSEMGATNTLLKTLIDDICVGEEFALLREALLFYCDEINVH